MRQAKKEHSPNRNIDLGHLFKKTHRLIQYDTINRRETNFLLEMTICNRNSAFKHTAWPSVVMVRRVAGVWPEGIAP